MGNIISKQSILDEIKAMLEKSRQYQGNDPDESAENRVNNAKIDPCGIGKYYVNITLKSPEISETTKLSERLKHLKSKKYLANLDEIQDKINEIIDYINSKEDE